MPKQTQGPKAAASNTCKQITALIVNYVSDRLTPSRKRKFEEHLKICPDCVNFFNTYKKTIAVSHSLDPVAIPANVRKSILAFLHKKIA